MTGRTALAAGAVLVAAMLVGCGGSSSGGAQSSAPNPNGQEVSPAGDIPDNQAFVRYAPPGGNYSVKVPEGWARKKVGTAVVFTDKLNAVRMESVAAPRALSVAAARRTVVAALGASLKDFAPGAVSSVTRPAGTATLIKYQADGAPDPVTGRVRRDAFERYVFFHAGRQVVLTLSGPKGADNVDPWKLVTSSLRWTR
jgi:hypothetical protein